MTKKPKFIFVPANSKARSKAARLNRLYTGDGGQIQGLESVSVHAPELTVIGVKGPLKPLKTQVQSITLRLAANDLVIRSSPPRRTKV